LPINQGIILTKQ